MTSIVKHRQNAFYVYETPVIFFFSLSDNKVNWISKELSKKQVKIHKFLLLKISANIYCSFVLVAMRPEWQYPEAEGTEPFPPVPNLLGSLNRIFKFLCNHKLLENLQLFRLTHTGKFKDDNFSVRKCCDMNICIFSELSFCCWKKNQFSNIFLIMLKNKQIKYRWWVTVFNLWISDNL